MDKKLKDEIDLAFRSSARLVTSTNQEMPRRFLITESKILLKRAFSIWWRIRWPWLQRQPEEDESNG